jgi:soluble lytic murein transglycosylase-like protein
MAVERPLTIRDYFNPVREVAGGGRAAAASGRSVVSFRDLLARESSQKAAAPVSGLSLADYFARPVRSPQGSRLSTAAARKRPAAAPAETGSAGRPLAMQEASSAGAEVPSKTRSAQRPEAPVAAGRRGVRENASRAAVEEAIREAAAAYSLPPELIRSVIRAESGFRADAISPAGAQGLMQLMPATAAELGVSDPFDVRQNIDGGARYLRRMLDRFDGDLRLALSAYNAGPGAVERYAGRVPFAETRNYVERVLRFAGLTA